METVSLTIDGQQVTVHKGKTVLQAAIEAGISVPYYCFHPGLTVDGSCRVCIVKIEKMPKLQTSCSTVCTEGMVVTTRDAETTQARAGVLEFLLVNHPLDCPVCDKGGECPLQDFSYSFGPAESRMDFPRRVFDGEGVRADVDFGPTLMLNRNRCILCTRCVRFMREIDGDAQISIADRGNGSEIATFREEGVHSLLSGNLMDVCPVGAITTREYRFKSRPWDNPGVVDTTCTLCSKGCNTSAWQKAKPEWAKGSRLIRMTPRLNPEINGYWMCDIGRFDYHWVEGHYAAAPSDGSQRARRSNRSRGMTSVRSCAMRFSPQVPPDPSSVRFLVSAHASTEELFVLKEVVTGLLGNDGMNAVTVTWKNTPKNAAGRERSSSCLRLMRRTSTALATSASRSVRATATTPDTSALRTAITSGRVKALYVVDPGPDGSLGDVSWIVTALAGTGLAVACSSCRES